jgi:hypothetical protein
MSKLFSLLFVLLVGTISSMTTKSKLSPFEENLLPQHSIMKRLNTLFVQLKDISDSSSKVKTYAAFTKVIQSLIDDLQRDTKKHEAVLEEMQKQCLAENQFREKEVADADKAKNNADASRKICQTHLAKAESLLSVAKNLLAAEEEKKRQRTEIRRKENEIFRREKAQYDQAIDFLREFNKLVANRFGNKNRAAAFIEFSEDLLRHTAKIGKVEAAVPVLIMLSQYTSGARGDYKNFDGAAASKNLVDRLNSLLATIEADLAKIVKIENDRERDFQAFLVLVNRNIADLKASIATLNAQITANKECIARETKVFDEASKKRLRNADLKERAIKMCAKFVEEVMEAQKARQTEVNVIRQILNLMNVRFGKVPQSMNDYLDNVEKGFKEYENKTKLIAFQIYKHITFNNNAHAADIVVNTDKYRKF